jgi:hypothetical protein
MSSMIQAPPQSIPLPGAGPAAGPGGPGAGPDPSQQAPDSAKVSEYVKQAIKFLRMAEDAEGHDPDAAILAAAVAQLRKFVGAQTDLGDQAMGAGPGVKLIRKNASGPAAGGAGGGY